jgi:hypothetical protein
MKRADDQAVTSVNVQPMFRRLGILIFIIATMVGFGRSPEAAAAYRDGDTANASGARRLVDGSGFGLRAPPQKAKSPAILLAHAIVVRRSPEQGGLASDMIGKVEVWYDAGIRDAFAALAVVSAAGERVDKRDAAIDKADPAHVTVSVDRLAPGKYTVRYRALSADGHLVSGAWDFEVRP